MEGGGHVGELFACVYSKNPRPAQLKVLVLAPIAPRRAEPRLRALAGRVGMNMQVIQCWFCREVNLLDAPIQSTAAPEPLCVNCRTSLTRVPSAPAISAPLALVPAGASRASAQPPTLPAPVAPPGTGVAPWENTPAHLDPAAGGGQSAEAVLLEVHDVTTVAVASEVVAPRLVWVLEFENGATFPLPASDCVVGRHPAGLHGAYTVLVPDPAKTLSKSHAKLRYDDGAAGTGWTVEDLGSANGTSVLHSDGRTYPAPKGTPTPVTEYLLLGLYRARIRPATEAETLSER